MELLDQKMKKMMEECKIRAKAAGLQVKGETLEYIITNRNMLELMSKNMIPTLYDFWIQDLEIIRNQWMYEIYPKNPYETVINTRPPISFYNQDNPDWVNIFIFYHVLAHLDFYQNNIYYRNTWSDDFCGQALADKRLINKIREELGSEKRWVDYVIEFASQVDNLVGYYPELTEIDKNEIPEIFGRISEKTDFYFGEFLNDCYKKKFIELKFYNNEMERLNRQGEEVFFQDKEFRSKFPEFNEVFKKRQENKSKAKPKPKDLLQYLMENSEFLNKNGNKWMKDIIQIIRRTSLHFQPQLRDSIANEGWASFWHEKLFITDKRINPHEVDFSIINAGVVADSRIGFNLYAVGKHLFEFIEEMARRGKLSREYQIIKDIEARKHFNQNQGEEYAKTVLCKARENFDDYQLINFLSDEDFQNFLNQYKMFLVGIRPHRDLEKLPHGKIEFYIKSKNAKDFRQLLNKALYHPPHYVINPPGKSQKNELYIDHIYEGRTLVTKYIPAVLIGLSYFWGDEVKLETTEFELEKDQEPFQRKIFDLEYKPIQKFRVLYACNGKNIEKKIIEKNVVYHKKDEGA